MRGLIYGTALMMTLGLMGCANDMNGSLSRPRSELVGSSPTADGKGAADLSAPATASPQNMSALPLEVRSAFVRDYPGVNITSTTVQPTKTGDTPLYKVGFMRNGQVETVTYDSAGRVVIAPVLPVPNP